MHAVLLLFAMLTPDSLRSVAHDYYEWNLREYPVGASDSGRHTWDDRLTDYSPGAVQRRAAHVREVLDRVRATDIANWSKDDKIDWILFRAQLERTEFGDRVLKSEEMDPQVYI